MKGPFGTLGVTKGPFGASGATPLANQPTASGVFPDARAGRKMVAGASARGHLVVPRVLAIFELASLSVAKVPLATWVRTSRPAGFCSKGTLRNVERRKFASSNFGDNNKTSGGNA